MLLTVNSEKDTLRTDFSNKSESTNKAKQRRGSILWEGKKQIHIYKSSFKGKTTVPTTLVK